MFFSDASSSTSGKKLSWTNDGANGPNDPQCSEKILFDWLLTPGNYENQWRGRDHKKKEIAENIAKKMMEAGVKVKRDGKNVINKIQHAERKFKDASYFCKSKMGQRLKLENPDDYDATVRKISSYYFELLDIFKEDDSCRQTKATTTIDDDNLESSYDSESEVSFRRNNLDTIGDLLFSDDDSNNDDDKASNDSQIHKNVSNMTKQKDSNRSNKKRTSTASGITSNEQPDKRGTSVTSTVEENETCKPTHSSLMTTVQEKMAIAHLRKLEREEKLQKMDEEKQRIEMTLFKVNCLKEVHDKFPDMEDSDILNLFPDFQDIIQYLKKPSSRT
jgi:hypothetical protein